MRVQAVHVWPPLMKQLARPDLHRLGQVGVVEDDDGALAAELQRHPLHRAGADRLHPLARGGGAGERHHVDVGVRGERLAHHGAHARDEVEHARRQPHLLEHLGQRERRQRRHLAGLEHDGAPGRQRRGDLGHDLVQRVVPRRDGADDADRLLDDQRVADLLVPVVGLQDLRVGPQHLDRVAHLHGGGEPQRRPHLGGDERRDLVGPRLERVGGGRQQRRAVGAGRDAQPSKAARAARTAASTSSAVPAGTVATCSSVAGSTTARVSRPSAGTHRPSM
jgi:hypothetical protein